MLTYRNDQQLKGDYPFKASRQSILKLMRAKNTLGFIILGVCILIAAIVLVAVRKNPSTSDQTSNTGSQAPQTNNLELQNECIKNAQSADMTNPAFYQTNPNLYGGVGWTVFGQQDLQQKTAQCQQQYPTP